VGGTRVKTRKTPGSFVEVVEREKASYSKVRSMGEKFCRETVAVVVNASKREEVRDRRAFCSLRSDARLGAWVAKA
jgi:hypothetical protein